MGSYGILGVFAAPDVGGDTKTLANKEEEEERTEVSHTPKTSLETLHHFPYFISGHRDPAWMVFPHSRHQLRLDSILKRSFPSQMIP